MLSEFRKARQVGTPIIFIRTPDPTSTIKEIEEFYAASRKKRREAKEKTYTDDVTILKWDISQGVTPVNKQAEKAAASINYHPEGDPPSMVTGRPDEALSRILNGANDQEGAPRDSIVFFLNMHIILESKEVERLPILQGVWNLRDGFKSTERTAVFLVPDIKLPPELSNDAIILDVPLPMEDELGEMVKRVYKNGIGREIDDELLKKATSTIVGLSRFTAEQVVSMSLSAESETGFDMQNMWNRKKSIIEQVGGLTVADDRVTFDDIGGNASVKGFLRQVINGRRKPRLIVLLDEIGKKMNSSTGDSSGTQQDALGEFLTAMQDNDWSGVLLPGVSGTGKTELGKAMGTEADGLFVKFDFGGMKDMWVGNSEKMIRAAISILKAMGGSDVFFIGTSNEIDTLKPELRARFAHGSYFFDIPTAEERKPIWEIWMKKYKHEDQPIPDSDGWVGRDIRNCCRIAWELNISLVDAGKRVTPAARSMGSSLKALRLSAHNKLLSASNEGFYQTDEKKGVPSPSGKTERRIDLTKN